MASESCQHSKRISAVVKLDFVRPNALDGPIYSGAVSVVICEGCGHIELYAKLHHLLSDWLQKT